MKNLFRYSIITLFSAIILTGCGEADERRHPLYIKALQDQQTGDGAAAADKLNELLKRRPRSVHTHKLLASIYDEMLNNPAQAVYHYQAYLQAMPDAADAEETAAWLLQAEKRHYAILHQKFGKENITPPPAEYNAQNPAENTPDNSPDKAEKPADNPAEPAVAADEKTPDLIAERDKEIAELKEKLHRYQNRYQAIRREVEKLRNARAARPAAAPETPAAPAVTANETRAPAAPAPATVDKKPLRQYKVAAGDTPGSIARKVYGKSSLHYVIMRANPQVDARKLRPGMVLNIPQRQENLKQGN